MRIRNADVLTSHGNRQGREAVVQILEAGLQAGDPYHNTRKLLRVEDGKLIVGHPDFEPAGSPETGNDVYDLSKVGRIYVFGAGKGIQRAAKAFEDVLGDRLTGGHVIGKHGDDVILERIGVTLGGHPVPDDYCAVGCRRIIEMAQGLTEEDLVFTLAANGISSLLTLPVDGINMAEVTQLTYLMQIDRGAPTGDLNQVRNHLDQMKGGRITRHLYPARMVHLILFENFEYDWFMHKNLWLHTLPDCTTFADAIAMLKKWDAWDHVSESVRQHLLHADPACETVKAAEYEDTFNFRIFAIMPSRLGPVPTAARKAEELGYAPHVLATGMQAEAREAGRTVGCIARSIEKSRVPFEPPCALLSSGELLVTVGEENGVGGRNQEFALGGAMMIFDTRNVVMGSVDTDGTDGPGGRFADDQGDVVCLAGGIVDGETMAEAQSAGVSVHEALRTHSTSAALWRLDSGIVAEHNVSVGDLTVTLITKEPITN
jgi:glycerate 2-kinase